MSSTGPISLAPVRSPPMEIQYVLPHDQSFWQWSLDGRVIEWLDGSTIAFREEIVAIINRLAPSGLPPFGSIVLLLAATRDNWRRDPDNADRILAGYTQLQEVKSLTRRRQGATGQQQLLFNSVVTHRARQELTALLSDLEVIANLPADSRTSAAAIRALMELVFSEEASTHMASNRAIFTADAVANRFDPEYTRWSSGRDENFAIFASEVHALSRGLAKVSAESLANWMKTGLLGSVKPAEIETPPATRVRTLLSELRADAELSGLARLAQDLLAAIHLPRAITASEDLPVGGVSDIANRGPLDRLLLSELAHDDLTLAVRVAVGEALYLRRESPAQHPPLGRAILIDAGIRLWGIPRLYATAVAMALVASSDQRGAVFVHRTHSATIEQVDLLTKQGVLKHLEALEPSPNPGASLSRWIDALDQHKPDDGQADLERFIVTHEDVLNDREFARHLADLDNRRDLHVATVARDGSFRLWVLGPAGRREICSAELDLNAILASSPQAPDFKLSLQHGDPTLPAILNMHPFPLLLPANVEARHAVASPKLGLIGITGDRRLMRWQSEVKGAEQLSPNLPRGHIEGIFGDDDHGLVHVVMTNKAVNKLHLLTYDIGTDHSQIHDLRGERPQHVYSHLGLIFLIGKKEVRVITPHSGDERKISLDPATRWMSGRFFHSPKGTLALSGDGSSFEVVTRRGAHAMFDRWGRGPWILFKDGDVGPADGDPIYVKRSFANCWIKRAIFSADGDRIMMQIAGQAQEHNGFYFLNLANDKQLAWRKLGYKQASDALFAPLIGDRIHWSTWRSISIRNRFPGAFVTGDGELALATRRGHAVFKMSHNGDLHLSDIASMPPHPLQAPFQRMTGLEGIHFTIKQATWKDGSRALLDSRGMLHLISSDRRLPQMTLTLSTRSVAGWCSNGQTFGWAYFLKSPATSNCANAAEILRQFCSRLQ